MYTTNTLTVKTESASQDNTDTPTSPPKKQSFIELLAELELEETYADLIKYASIAYVRTIVELGFRHEWTFLVNTYKKVWGKRRNLDFSALPILDAPELPIDDFDTWVDQMESEFGDMADYQASVATGIRMS